MDPYFPSQPAAEAHARKDTYLTNNWPMCIYLNILPRNKLTVHRIYTEFEVVSTIFPICAWLHMN